MEIKTELSKVIQDELELINKDSKKITLPYIPGDTCFIVAEESGFPDVQEYLGSPMRIVYCRVKEVFFNHSKYGNRIPFVSLSYHLSEIGRGATYRGCDFSSVKHFNIFKTREAAIQQLKLLRLAYEETGGGDVDD